MYKIFYFYVIKIHADHVLVCAAIAVRELHDMRDTADIHLFNESELNSMIDTPVKTNFVLFIFLASL